MAVLLLWMHMSLQAQFKSQVENQPSAAEFLVHPSTGFSSLLSWFNPDNFRMRQSISMNYFTYGGQSLSLASYTNSMFYKFADPIDVRFDVTLQGSPFGQNSLTQQNALNRVFLSNAELNYHPLENFFIKLQYSQLPYGNYGWYSRSPYSLFPGE